MRQCLLDLKNKVAGSKMYTKLDLSEEREINGLAFNAGCTSCVVLITKDTIYCANAGDSRACLATKKGKVIDLSHDHKPDNEGELKRVKAAGGFVEEGRVQGVIAVSRAIGDWEYKNPKLLAEMDGKKRKSLKKKKNTEEEKAESPGIKGGNYPGAGKVYRNIEEAKKHQVSSFPDIIKVPLKADYDFLINACDGIWDCYTNEEAVVYAMKTREKGPRAIKTKKRTKDSSGSPLKIDKKSSLGERM
jgi:serine/threonine protein phosphatase PrpC